VTADSAASGLPQEAVDAAGAAITRSIDSTERWTEPGWGIEARAALTAALPFLRQQREAEHWSASFTLSVECPAGLHPQWAVDHEDTTTCPGCALAAEQAKVAGLRDQRQKDARIFDEQTAHLDRLRETVDKVRALHKPLGSPTGSDDPRVVCDDCDVPYPCPTLRALDGETPARIAGICTQCGAAQCQCEERTT
jgi:hypothetical protein